MAKKVELLVTLRGSRELWPAGTVFDYDKMPGDVAAEVGIGRGTVRIFEQVDAPAVPPPPPPADEPSFSDVAKEILEEALEEAEPPPYLLEHQGGGWYDVIEEESGTVMNRGKSLRKEDALKLVKKLTEKEEKPTLIVREEEDG